ncbi:MAG: fadA [Gemmatimonadetes bacterium]|nr:fadA [Gemmatimonadota bacterium]
MPDAFIYDHVRTPRGRGKPNGSLHEVTPIQLAAQTLAALRDRNELDTSRVDDVILGCGAPVGEQGSDIARIAVLQAGYAETVTGKQVDRFCASGLEAVNSAAAQVMAGMADLAIGGGVEAMSRVPLGGSGGAWFTDPQAAFATRFVPQGISADLIATLYGYSREDVDRYAVESQRRAAHAWASGWFDRSVVPVRDVLGLPLLERDEHLRPETTLESLAALSPSFVEAGEKYGYDAVALQRYPMLERIHHVHHAGNSSGIVDGAGAVLVGNRKIGKALGLEPRARIRAFATIGTEPTIMLTGPSFATEKALKRAKMTVADVDLFELNEAFAAVVLRYMDVLSVPHDRINVNGGAIAMGHPIGATGAIILGTLLDEMERRGAGTGLATLCIGGGMGIATIIERV